MFYGRSGTGKTTIAGTFPGKKLLADIKDVGDDSLAGVKNVKVYDVRDWNDFIKLYWWLNKHPDEYDTVILDTMSQLQQLAILHVSGGTDASGWGELSRKQWGKVSAMMKTWILAFRDLPCQVVFIAQDRVFNVGEEDEVSGLDPEVGPALSPSTAKAMNAAVHAVVNTFIRRRVEKVKVKDPPKGQPPWRQIERIEFCARIGPNPMYVTKIRKPKQVTVPDVVVDPTYDKLITIITGDSK